MVERLVKLKPIGNLKLQLRFLETEDESGTEVQQAH